MATCVYKNNYPEQHNGCKFGSVYCVDRRDGLAYGRRARSHRMVKCDDEHDQMIDSIKVMVDTYEERDAFLSALHEKYRNPVALIEEWYKSVCNL